MAIIKRQENQNILDLALQEYGSIEGLFDLMEDNELDRVDHEFTTYEDIHIESDPTRREILEFYKSRAILPATGLSEEDLRLEKVMEQDCGIGCMIIEDDFIVAPTEKVTLSGTIYNTENFDIRYFKMFAEALVYEKYKEDNTLEEAENFSLDIIEDDKIDFVFEVAVANRYRFMIDPIKLGGIYPPYRLYIPLANIDNTIDIDKLIDLIEQGEEFRIEILEVIQPR